MAGDWIPIRCNIHDDPAVISIAAATGLDEHAVVGRLVKLWAWANQHTTDGNARGVTETFLERYIGVTGFTAALLAVGWIERVDGGVAFPNFDRWNSSSAKKRVATNLRVSKHRGNAGETQLKRVCNADSVTEALPEKRREEKREERQPPSEVVCSEPPPAAPEPAAPPVLAVPTTGQGAKEWHLTPAKLAEYEAAFPTIDVLGALRAAAQWCRDNPGKRKTAKGMPAFCSNWLNGCVRRGQNLRSGPPARAPTPRRDAGAAREDYVLGTINDALTSDD